MPERIDCFMCGAQLEATVAVVDATPPTEGVMSVECPGCGHVMTISFDVRRVDPAQHDGRITPNETGGSVDG